MSGYKYRKVRATYTAHHAVKQHECIVCGGTIEPGEVYLRRVIYRNGIAKGAISKCGQCVTIQEINSNE